MASPSEENRLLVFGVPSDIDSSLAARKLMIHFQKTAVSGGAEVDRVTVSSTYSNAYDVYFLEDQEDAVLTVLQQPLQTVDFGGKQFTCSVSGFPNQRHHRRDSAHEQKLIGMARSKKVAQKKAASSSASSKRAVTGMVPANGSCLQQQTVNSIIVISFYNSGKGFNSA